MSQYLGSYAELLLGISLHELLALGRQNLDDSSESFNMDYLDPREWGGQWRKSLAWQGETTPL